MGLFDYFSKDAGDARKRERALKKLTNMYYQQADRMASADSAFELAEQGDTEAVKVLLARFEHLCPSHTVDREEKEYVVNLLVALGDKGVETISDYCRKTTKAVFWPLKVLEKLWPADMLADFISEVLENTDTDYWRDPEKKIGLMQIAAPHHGERLSKALLPFVEDHAEEVRFGAVDALMGREFDAREALLERLAGGEESLRVKQRLAKGFADKGWDLGDRTDAVIAALPPGFEVKSNKVVAS